MAHFDDARALVDHARQAMDRLKAAYSESLAEKIVKPALAVEIKNLT